MFAVKSVIEQPQSVVGDISILNCSFPEEKWVALLSHLPVSPMSVCTCFHVLKLCD
jgi:hypothetical protein